MNKQDKIQFLKDLKAGKTSIQVMIPITFMTFYNLNGVITDTNGNVSTEEEINAGYNFRLNKTWVEILTYDNEASKNQYHG